MFLLAALLGSPCNAHPAYAAVATVTNVRVEHRSHGYLATAHVRFELKTTAPAMLPSVDDPGLLQHVHGHLLVARRAIQSSDGNVEANGASAAQARTRLNQTISRMRTDVQNELMREERAYDNVTANGMQQSQGPSYGFPGGPDAHEPCAQ